MTVRLFYRNRAGFTRTQGAPTVFRRSLSLMLVGLWAGAAMAQQAGEGTGAAPTVTGPRPIIKLDRLTHDFGTTWIDQELKYVCKISNIGDAPLEIQRITPGCGSCTTVGEHPSRLEPGQSGEIPLQMITSKLVGQYSKTVQIHTNDPVSPVTSLTLTGECKWYVTATPSYVSFPAITDQQPHEQIVTLVNNVEQPLEITFDPAQVPAGFKLDLFETKRGREFQLKVSTVPPLNQGIIKGQAVLTTNFEAQKNIQIQLFAKVPPRLEVTPSALLLQDKSGQPNQPSQIVSRIINFTNNGQQPVKLLEATTDDATLQLEVKPQIEGKTYFVQVKMPHDYVPPPEGRVIALKTDDLEQSVITVPVRRITRPIARPTPQALLGLPAPSFSLKTTRGGTISNTDLIGAIALLNLVSFNDTAGQQQLSMVEKLRPAYENKGVRFIYVHQTSSKGKIEEQELMALAQRSRIEGDVASDAENSLGQLFNVKQYPTMIVLGRDGKVVAVNEGTTYLDFSMQVQLNSLLADMPIPNLTAVLAAAQRPAQGAASARPAMELKGKPAPEFAVKTLDGKDVTSKDFANHPATILNFVAANCGYCKRQIPQVEKVRQTYEAKGVRFVNMVQTMRTEFTVEQVTEVMNSLGAKLELVKDEKNATGRDKYKVVSFPTMVVVGRDGVVQDVVIGAKADLAETLSQQLDSLIDKGSGPATSPSK